ncbi:hypothetical protein F8S13_26435 [Chloroflexia bacterium SDU3-3]|nr:hypothetical protein F8S13_26435 [Chloroflexia bacterium SDU3-3]
MHNILATAAVLALTIQPAAPTASPQFCSATSPTTYIPASAGSPASTVISCAFAGNTADRVTVFDRDGDMRDTGNWTTAVDFDHDLWVFDAGGDGTANLIIAFSQDRDAIAEVYDDQNSDGKVSYHIQDGSIIIDESQFWTVQMRAQGGWWQQGEKINYNLDIAVDGPVMAQESYDRFLDRIKNDGHTDFAINVRDPKNIGAPIYDIRTASTDLPENWGLRRVNIAVDEQPHANQQLDYWLFWPFLGTSAEKLETSKLIPFYSASGQTYGLVQAYSHRAPPIQVAWSQSKIMFVAELTPTRAKDNGWFIYSHYALRSGETYVPDFEAPFSFYDIANDHDGIPELLVRVEHYLPNDRYFKSNRLIDFPTTMLRYSWDQNNDGKWDYSFNGITHKEFAKEDIQLGDLTVHTAPYTSFAQNMTSLPWDVITLAQSMEGGYRGQEGIYTWGILNDLRDNYLLGDTDTPDTSSFQVIDPGFRGEYAIRTDLPARVYISPVDGQLHLLNAQAGLWVIDGQNRVQYRSAAGTPYIDEWRSVQANGVVTSTTQLNVADQYLTLFESKSGTLTLRQAHVTPSLAESTPPTNHEEWLAMGRKLDAAKPAFAPQQVSAMFNQFSGPTQQIQGVQMSDYRATGNSFSFVLKVLPGFTSAGRTLLDLAHITPGEYLIRYDGTFHAEPFVPAEVRATAVEAVGGAALAAQTVHVTLENTGTLALASVPVVLTARLGETNQVMTATLASVPAHGSTRAQISWTPTKPGEWELSAAAGRSAIATKAEVLAATMPDPNWSFARIGGQPLAIGAVAVALLATLLAFSISFARRSSSTPHHDTYGD